MLVTKLRFSCHAAHRFLRPLWTGPSGSLADNWAGNWHFRTWPKPCWSFTMWIWINWGEMMQNSGFTAHCAEKKPIESSNGGKQLPSDGLPVAGNGWHFASVRPCPGAARGCLQLHAFPIWCCPICCICEEQLQCGKGVQIEFRWIYKLIFLFSLSGPRTFVRSAIHGTALQRCGNAWACAQNVFLNFGTFIFIFLFICRNKKFMREN